MASRILANAGVMLCSLLAVNCFATSSAAARTNILCPPVGAGQPGAVVSYVFAGPNSPNLCELSYVRASEPSSPVPRVLETSAAGSPFVSPWRPSAIRQTSTGDVQVIFDAVPPATLRWVDNGGSPVSVQWINSRIAALSAMDRVVLTDGQGRIEIARVAQSQFYVPPTIRAAIHETFEHDGATYFILAESVRDFRVTDAQGNGTGERKNRYYRFDGVSDAYVVSVDGSTASVARSETVRFYVREVRS